MKAQIFTILSGMLLAAGMAQAQNTPATYVVTITNSSLMPLSPGILYAKSGAVAAAAVGEFATTGLVQLCQTGNNAVRANELRANMNVTSVTPTLGMIQPGESKIFEIMIAKPELQSLHFETMYGKTKDVCGVATVNSHSLVALRQHVTSEFVVKDETLLSGAFKDPALPAGMSYPYPGTSFCSTAMDAISCLRELATANSGRQPIRSFAGYFPSLVTTLEMKYGAADVQTLLFPTSGAIQLKIKLKH